MFGNIFLFGLLVDQLRRSIAAFAGGLHTEESDWPLSTIFFWGDVESIMVIRMMMYVVISTTISNNTV